VIITAGSPTPQLCCSQPRMRSRHAQVPVRHRVRVRTTNLAERSFEEERRRTKVIPRLMDEKAAMKLVFATMIRAAERWCRVSITDLERHQLRLLRGQHPGPRPPEMRLAAAAAR
jgi:putative transposase